MDEYKIVSIEEGLTKIEFPEYEKVSSAAPVLLLTQELQLYMLHCCHVT